MDIDQIVVFAASFEKMAQSKKVPMGTPDQPDIRGIYTNVNLLMDYAKQMTAFVNDSNNRLKESVDKAVGQVDYFLKEIYELRNRVKALE